MSKSPYLLQRPEQRTSPVVFASPHSGRHYPQEMLDRALLNPLHLRSSEDAHVDRLFSDVPRFGAVMLSAVYPRAWVDLNRRSDELDPALIAGVSRVGLNPRIASGLGVIPRVVAGGRNIYRGKISRQDAQSRLDKVWTPYHRLLKALLDESCSLFGEAILVDCHSMPREALSSISAGRGGRPDIVIGDRYGASATPRVTTEIEQAFRSQGFSVTRNVPFAGAFVVQNYGQPARKQHAIQVEIDRSLYMNEKTLEPRADFGEFRARISAAAKTISEIRAEGLPLAAE